MGDDTPLAVLSDKYRPLHHFFRQNSQVTNPPIDSLREYNVMSLTTRLGNLGNILIDGPQQCEIMQLKARCSPTVSTTPFVQKWATQRPNWTAPCRWKPAIVSVSASIV